MPSPTFPLRIDHALPRLKVVHADLYRLGGAGELDEIGLEEALADGALLVEWPERLPPDLSANGSTLRSRWTATAGAPRLSAAGTWPARLRAHALAIRAFLDDAGWRGRDARVRCRRRLLPRL